MDRTLLSELEHMRRQKIRLSRESFARACSMRLTSRNALRRYPLTWAALSLYPYRLALAQGSAVAATRRVVAAGNVVALEAEREALRLKVSAIEAHLASVQAELATAQSVAAERAAALTVARALTDTLLTYVVEQRVELGVATEAKLMAAYREATGKVAPRPAHNVDVSAPELALVR